MRTALLDLTRELSCMNCPSGKLESSVSVVSKYAIKAGITRIKYTTAASLSLIYSILSQRTGCPIKSSSFLVLIGSKSRISLEISLPIALICIATRKTRTQKCYTCPVFNDFFDLMISVTLRIAVYPSPSNIKPENSPTFLLLLTHGA